MMNSREAMLSVTAWLESEYGEYWSRRKHHVVRGCTATGEEYGAPFFTVKRQFDDIWGGYAEDLWWGRLPGDVRHRAKAAADRMRL